LVKYEIPPGDEHPHCYKETKGVKGSLEVLYDLSVLTIQYIGPVLIMVYSYGMIAHTIWRKTDSGLVSFFSFFQISITRKQSPNMKEPFIIIILWPVFTISNQEEPNDQKAESQFKISAHADWGPRSQVCARETLRSAPNRRERKFFGALVCRAALKKN
jgi:hypothetical protein